MPANAKNSDRNAAVIAIAQMGVHLVFFSTPDSTNNILSLAFDIFVVGLLIFGSMIIMANLNQNMMLYDQMLDMHLQR
jgi:cytochrome o ubiquinol oxidase operon protein cyoD